MKRQMNNSLKESLSLMMLLFISINGHAQPINAKKDNRIYTSIDLTQYGRQYRIAYDFYTKKNKCIGFSIAQVGGISKDAETKTYYFDQEACRINLGFRFTNYLYTSKRVGLFGLLSAGVSYNTFITGEHLVLPSLHLGMGVDFILIKSSGVRLEAGYGAPYMASAGYFFKF
jgi:hypothetical protein